MRGSVVTMSTQALKCCDTPKLQSGTANSSASAATSSSVRVAAGATAPLCPSVGDSSGVRLAKTAVAHAVAGMGSTLVTADDRLGGVSVPPLLLDDVSDGVAV
jgi:hypothetical protein